MPSPKLKLMAFFDSDDKAFADCVLGHIPFHQLMDQIKEEYEVGDQPFPTARLRYEYAVFRTDEKCVFNVSPATPKAKAVTVAYYQWIPEQKEIGHGGH